MGGGRGGRRVKSERWEGKRVRIERRKGKRVRGGKGGV